LVGSAPSPLIKISVSRFAFAMAEELHKHRVAAVAITPGFLRTEAMLNVPFGDSAALRGAAFHVQ